MRKLILLFAVTLLTLTVFGQENIDPQRPTLAESSTIVGKGVIQSENGAAYGNNNWSYGTFFRYGLADRIEFRASSDLESSNLGLGGKIYILDQDGIIPSASFVMSYDFTNGVSVTDYRLALTYSVQESYTVAINAGNDIDWYGIILIGKSFGEKTGAFIEAYLRDGYTQYHGGLTRRLTNNIQIDISGGLMDNEDFYAGAGFSFRIK